MKDTMTCFSKNNPGVTMRKMLISSVKMKCEPILLDTRINAERTVALNLFQCFVYNSFKFYHLGCALPAAGNGGFFVATLRGMIYAAAERIEALRRDTPGFTCALGGASVEWLGLKAFQTVFSEGKRPRVNRFNAAVRYAEHRLLKHESFKEAEEKYGAFCLEHTSEMLANIK